MLCVEGLRGLGGDRQDAGDPDASWPGELAAQSRLQHPGCHRVDEVNHAWKHRKMSQFLKLTISNKQQPEDAGTLDANNSLAR